MFTKLSKQEEKRYESYLNIYKMYMTRQPKSCLARFCETYFLDYDSFRGWMRRRKGLTATSIRKEVLEKRQTRNVNAVKQLAAAVDTLHKDDKKTRALTKVEPTAPKVNTDEVKNIDPPIKWLEGEYARLRDEFKNGSFNTRAGYAWYMLPEGIQKLISILDGVDWQIGEPSSVSIAPAVSAEVDAALLDKITIEFPEGVRTTMKDVSVAHVSKVLAAYAIRKEAYQRAPRKTGIA